MTTTLIALLATVLPAAAIACAWLYERWLGRSADELAGAVGLRRAEAEAEARARADRLGWEAEAALWLARQRRQADRPDCAPAPNWWPSFPAPAPRPGLTPLEAILADLRGMEEAA